MPRSRSSAFARLAAAGQWIREFFADFASLAVRLWRIAGTRASATSALDRKLQIGSMVGVAVFVGVAIALATRQPLYRIAIPTLQQPPPPPPPPVDLKKPVREEPARFRANTHMPRAGEGASSTSIRYVDFSPDRDLVRIEDDRVWWESEHDRNDTEDDHVFHYAMEEPIRRLIELVDKTNAKLKIQDAYRDRGIHAKESLHKQGRAVDVTAEGISLEKLAKLCWAAGFDWVYYESPRRGGAHVHASVRERELLAQSP